MTTFMAKKDAVDRDWFLVDAQGKVLGRLAREIAHRLRGKHKTIFTPHTDTETSWWSSMPRKSD